MFKKTLTLTLGVIFFSPVVFSLPDSGVVQRCADDSLNPIEAIQRNQWALKCGYMSPKNFDFYIYTDEGGLRPRPKYQSFFNPRNFNDWIEAPMNKNAPCDIRHYTQKVYCVSSRAY